MSYLFENSATKPNSKFHRLYTIRRYCMQYVTVSDMTLDTRKQRVQCSNELSKTITIHFFSIYSLSYDVAVALSLCKS